MFQRTQGNYYAKWKRDSPYAFYLFTRVECDSLKHPYTATNYTASIVIMDGKHFRNIEECY